VKEEEELRAEVKRIEARKKERERKAIEVQRLINSTEQIRLSQADRFSPKFVGYNVYLSITNNLVPTLLVPGQPTDFEKHSKTRADIAMLFKSLYVFHSCYFLDKFFFLFLIFKIYSLMHTFVGQLFLDRVLIFGAKKCVYQTPLTSSNAKTSKPLSNK
jgi:hypothetical protein